MVVFLYYIPDFANKKKEGSKEILKLEMPEIIVKDLQLSDDFLYIYDGAILHTYSLTIPKN